jgi:hypothetical protein
MGIIIEKPLGASEKYNKLIVDEETKIKDELIKYHLTGSGDFKHYLLDNKDKLLGSNQVFIPNGDNIPEPYSKFYKFSDFALRDGTGSAGKLIPLFINNPNEYIKKLDFDSSVWEDKTRSNKHYAIISNGNEKYKKGIDINDRSNITFEQ